MISPRRARTAALRTLMSAAAAVVLIALAAAAARARRAVSYQPAGSTVLDALRQAAIVLAVSGVVAALGVLGSIVLRRRLAAPVLPTRRRMTRRERVLAGIAALLALAAVTVARALHGWHAGRPTRQATHRPPVRGSGPQSQWHLGASTGTVLVIVSILVVVAVAVLLRSRRHGSEPVADLAAQTLLAEAAAGGRRALLAAPDPREAIIAAYLAMEQHLADHGFSLARSRTAAEVLRDAAGRGYINREAGTVLVRLFERARFSAAPLTTADRRHALVALDALVTGTLR
jgi:hypothetical protein